MAISMLIHGLRDCRLFAARSLQGQVSLIQQCNQDLLWEGGYMRQLYPEVGRSSRLLVGALREGTVGSRGPSTLVDEVWEPPAEGLTSRYELHLS